MSNATNEKAAKESPKKTSAHSSEESMVVRLSRLDKMLELAGEVIIVSSNLNAISHQMREGQAISNTLAEDTKDLAITSSRISSDLHNLVTDVRTVDMTDLFARFRRLARDTSRRLGKAVRFEVEGEDIFIDKKISEKIYDPIAHQIRNAVAHGIEDDETRRKAGKDPTGNVTVRVRNLDNATVIDIIDDGAGIDIEKIRRKIVEKGYLEQRAADQLSEHELHEYLFLPGFSTAATTSSTAGRGVGMDVVRNVMNEINGETRILSKIGEGTTFSLILPLITAVNIADSLLVVAGKNYFAFPISSVLASQSIPVSEVTTTTGKGRSIIYLGAILPLFDLLETFGEDPIEPIDGQYRVIIIEHKKDRVAYVVSDFMNPQKIVISEFDSGMQVPGLLGTATLSGRQMGLVIDLPGLFEQTLGVQMQSDKLQAQIGGNGAISVEEDIEIEESVIPSDSDKITQDTQTAAEPIVSVVSEADSEFLQEVESMLGKLNRELLALEESKDRETADSIFRLVHSIKGNFAMIGAEVPAAIAHGSETILERARRGALELDQECFDVLFDSCAYLEESLAALLRGGQPEAASERLQEGLERYHEETLAQDDILEHEDSNLIHLDPTGEFYLSSRRREGTRLYQCHIEFEPADQPRFLLAYLILRQLQDVADVIGSNPTMENLEAGLCEGPLRVIIAPRSEQPNLMERLEKYLKRYYAVTSIETAPYA